MSAWTLATRELRRSASRYVLLAGIVALLTVLVVLQQAFLSGLIRQFNGGVRSGDADLYVLGVAADGALPASTVPGDAVGIARTVDGVDDAGAVRIGFARVLTGRDEVDVTLVGLDRGHTGAPTTMAAGRAVRADDEAVLSVADATEGLTMGATVRVRPGDRPLRIVGLAADANLGVMPTLYVSTSTFIALARDQRPGALSAAARTAVAVRVDGGADPAAVAGGLHRQIADVDVLTRAETAAAYPGIAEVGHSFQIILALLGVVVAVVAGLCFLVLTVHKRPTLTLLRAVGMPARTLVACLLLQVVVVVGVGVVVGTVLAAIVVGRIDAGFPVGVDVASATGSAAAMVALALLASGGAVRRVVRVDPAAALREST